MRGALRNGRSAGEPRTEDTTWNDLLEATQRVTCNDRKAYEQIGGMMGLISSRAVGYLDSYKELDESSNEGRLRISLHESGKDLSSTERVL